MFVSSVFLAASIAMAIQLLLNPIPTIYGFFYADPLTYDEKFCQIRMYIIQTTAFVYRWSFAMASVDRYALSSPHARLRNLANVNIAYRVLGVMVLGWALVSIQIPVVFVVQGGACMIIPDGFWPVATSLFSMFVGSFTPAIIMVIFTLLIRKNLANKRQRRQGLSNQQAAVNQGDQIQSRRDQQALRMLFAQIVAYVIISVPWNIYNLNVVVSSYIPNKSETHIAIEGFIDTVAGCLAYLFPALSFYLYTLTSSLFRAELWKMLRFIVCCQFLMNPRRIEPTTTNS